MPKKEHDQTDNFGIDDAKELRHATEQQYQAPSEDFVASTGVDQPMAYNPENRYSDRDRAHWSRRLMRSLGILVACDIVIAAVLAYGCVKAKQAGLPTSAFLWLLVAILILAIGIPLLRWFRGSQDERTFRNKVDLQQREERLPRHIKSSTLLSDEFIFAELHEQAIQQRVTWALILIGAVDYGVLFFYAYSFKSVLVILGIGLTAVVLLTPWWLTSWYKRNIILTNYRIILRTGVFKRRQREESYDKIQDVELVIPTASRFLSALGILAIPSGTLIIDSAGNNPDNNINQLDKLPMVEAVHWLITQLRVDPSSVRADDGV